MSTRPLVTREQSTVIRQQIHERRLKLVPKMNRMDYELERDRLGRRDKKSLDVSGEVPRRERRQLDKNELSTCEKLALYGASIGLSYKSTGDMFGWSQWTAKEFRRRAMAKMGTNNVTAAVACAIRLELIP